MAPTSIDHGKMLNEKTCNVKAVFYKFVNKLQRPLRFCADFCSTFGATSC